MMRAEIHRDERDGTVSITLSDEFDPRRAKPYCKFLALFYGETEEAALWCARAFVRRFALAADPVTVPVERPGAPADQDHPSLQMAC